MSMPFLQKGEEMATIQDIENRVKSIKPCEYDFTRWIAELDARIALDVMLMDISQCQELAYHRLPEEQQREAVPLLQFPHDELYDLWLYAKIDAADGEPELYQNDMAMFNAYFSEYAEWFVSTYDPAQNGSQTIRYYITAYALAVQQGFSGDLDSWLASLRGPTGKSAYEYAVEGGYTGTEEDYKTFMKSQVETDTTFTKGGIAADAAAVGMWKEEVEQASQELEQAVGTAQETADNALPKAGGTMTGELTMEKNINMGGNGLSNVADPTEDTDAVNLRTVKSREPVYGNTEIPADGWSEAAPYTVTVAVDGVSAIGGDVHIYPVYSADAEARAAQREAYNAISLVTPGENQITFTCDDEKPTVAIPIKVEVRKV